MHCIAFKKPVPACMGTCKPEETDPRNCAVEGRKFDQEKPRP